MKKLRIMLWKWIEGPAGRVPTVRRWLDRVVLPLAILTLTAPLAAQTDPCRNQSQTRTTSVQRNQITETRDSVVGVYVTRDSVRWRCVLRVATAPPPPVDTTPPPPPPPPVDTTAPPSGPFAAPDLVNLNFNNPADDSRIKNGGADLVAYQTWDATGGRNGSRALRVTVSSQYNNGFGPIGPIWPNRGRVFVRLYFRMQGTPSGNVKGYRFHADFSNLGEVYGGSPCWSFDWEPANWAGACVYAGMSYGPSSDPNSTCSNLADGNWHWYEIDYDRNAGANVEVRFWCDGQAVVMPDGLSARYFGQDIPAVWHGGSRTTNTPSTLRAARVDRNYLTGIYLWPTISQASGTATIWVDDVAASSQRIGP